MGNNQCFESGCLNRRIPYQKPKNYLYYDQRQNYINHHQNQHKEVKVMKIKPKQANFGFFQAYSINHNGKNEILEGILAENKNFKIEQSFSKIIKQKTAQSSSKNKQNQRMVSKNDVQFIKTQSVLVFFPNNEKAEKRRSNAFSITLVGNEDLSGMVLPSNTIKKAQKQNTVLNGLQLPPRCASQIPNKPRTGFEKANKFVKLSIEL